MNNQQVRTVTSAEQRVTASDRQHGQPQAMRLLAWFNRRATNPAFRALARRLPGYANVVHTGRRSGRRYRTPVGVTWHGSELQIALNYGRRSDWVRNVITAGRFDLEHRGRAVTLDEPEIVRIATRDFLRAVVRSP